MTSEVMVRPPHVRKAGLCMRGARAWVLAHGMSWSVFIEAGIECEAIEATGDPLALRAARIARDEAGNGK